MIDTPLLDEALGPATAPISPAMAAAMGVVYVFLDYETQSACDLKKCGTYVYAQHPSTRAYCAALRTVDAATGEQQRYFWTDIERDLTFDPDVVYVHGRDWLVELFSDRRVWIIAHNVAFEHATSTYCLKLPQPARWIDTMDLTLSRGMPGGADAAGAYLFGLPKDKDGYALMMRLCKPRKTRSAAPGTLPYISDREVQALVNYVFRDVEISYNIAHRFGMLMNTETEQRVRDIHTKTNFRGINFDRAFAEALRSLDEYFKEEAGALVERVTGGAITRADLTRNDFLREALNANLPEDLQLQNMQQATLEDILEEFDEGSRDDISPEVETVIRCRLIVTRAALSKVETGLRSACDDGYLRAQLRYWGAITGRWSGNGIQIQNFKRPAEDLDLKRAIRAIELGASARTAEEIDYARNEFIACTCRIGKDGKPLLDETGAPLKHPPYVLLGSLIRGVLIPSRGCQFVVGDFASVEARGLLWLAGDMAGLKEYIAADNGGADTYTTLAATMFKIAVGEVTKKQRSGGKVGILACLAPNTKIVTRRGIVDLADIVPGDSVWDGCEWVATDGVIYRGQRRTILWHGVELTPDHKMMLAEGVWKDVGLLSPAESMTCLQWGSAAALSLSFLSLRQRTMSCPRSASAASAAKRGRSALGTGGKVESRPARLAARRRGTQRIAPMRSAAAGFSGAYRLYLAAATTRSRADTETTEVAAYRSTRPGAKIASPSSPTWCRCQGGTMLKTRLIASTMSAGMSPAISVSSIATYRCATRESRTASSIKGSNIRSATFVSASAPATVLTTRSRVSWSQDALPRTLSRSRRIAAARMGSWNGKGASTHSRSSTAYTAPTFRGAQSKGDICGAGASTESSTPRRAVFDLLNCGPRNRFTIITDDGPAIVHNCGYGGGANAVSRMAFGMGIDLDAMGIDPQFVVDGFRTKYPLVVKLWRDYEDAFRTLLKNKRSDRCQAVHAGRCVFTKWTDRIEVTLPSGRILTYMNARIQPSTKKGREGRDEIVYDTAVKGAVRSKVVYAGLIAENLTQAVCRDALADVMVRAEDAGWTISFSVHDEIVLDVPDDCVEEAMDWLKHAMRTPPAWAVGFPLFCKPEIMLRYGK